MGNTLSGLGDYQAGKAQQSAMNRNADTLRAQAAANLAIAGDEMSGMREMQSADQASARAQQGASGLSSEGTGLTREVAVAKAWNDKVASAATSAAQSDINTRHQATMQEYEGKLARERGRNSLIGGLITDGVIGAASFGLGGLAGVAGGVGSGASAGASAGFNWGAATKSMIQSFLS